MQSIKSIKCNSPFDLVIKWRITNQCNAHCSYCIHGKSITNICDIERDLLKAIENSKYVNNLINKHPEKKIIKLELIGGEVSLFDIKKILDNINRLNALNITTNLLRDLDYYIDLADYCRERNIDLSVTASFHPESISLEKYVYKISSLKPKINKLCGEMVSLADNQELVKEFIKAFEELDVDYMVDKDFRRLDDKSDLIGTSKKTHRNPRYTVVFNDNEERVYTSRNQLMTDANILENRHQKYIQCYGLYCTHSYDFVYIDIDTVIGWSKDSDSDNCRVKQSIKEFDLLSSPRICKQSGLGCTLCGTFSVYR